MLCIHIIMNIHEHVWIWYGYALMCVHIVSALFQQTKEQKRKYKIYSVCRWIIEFNGTTKRLSIALCTPLNSCGCHLFIPCWATNFPEFHDVFSKFLLQNDKNVMMALQRIHSIIPQRPFLIPHHGQRTLAATPCTHLKTVQPFFTAHAETSSRHCRSHKLDCCWVSSAYVNCAKASKTPKWKAQQKTPPKHNHKQKAKKGASERRWWQVKRWNKDYAHRLSCGLLKDVGRSPARLSK